MFHTKQTRIMSINISTAVWFMSFFSNLYSWEVAHY